MWGDFSESPPTNIHYTKLTLCILLQVIPHASLSEKVLGLGGVGFELFAQPADSYVDRADVAVVAFIAPHLLKQLRARKYPAGVFR